jgi:ribosomal protein S12 methylthiotransferase accessory factor
VSVTARTGGAGSPESTWRVRAPEETWSLLEPRLAHYGITRVADVTELDVIGVPVYMGVRPLGTTLGVSQGKGKTHLLARVAAAMEAVEWWAAERFRPAEPLYAPAAGLDLPYRVEEVTPTERSVVSELLPLPWVPAESLTGEAPTLVPLHSVQLDGIADGRWRPRGVVISTNGLASGNSVAEATVQALLEVLERHETSVLGSLPIGQRKVLDLTTLPEGWCRGVIEDMQGKDFWVEVVDCSTLPGIFTFTVYIWRQDMPSIYAGAGSHIHPEPALYRALTEAVQSRMTVISGLRDDMDDSVYGGVRRPADPPPVTPNHSWPDLPAPAAVPDTSCETLAGWLASQVAALSGRPVLRVDLTPPGEPFAICRVIAPGLANDVYQDVSRDPGDGPP